MIGGGPAGFMAAITAAERGVGDVLILEATPEVLTKVRISGGGRSNVTTPAVAGHCGDPSANLRAEIRLLGSMSTDSRLWKSPMGECFPSRIAPRRWWSV